LRVHGVVANDAGLLLEGALLDLWQADHRGAYGPGLRGRLHAGTGGSYAIDTIVPGPYPEAGRMRPAHVHFKVDHPGHAPLTTQLFFAGDPYLFDDPHVRPGLVRPLEPQGGGGGMTCRFDIVLRKMSQ
jgi:catechol 1,2-dioxygenase